MKGAVSAQKALQGPETETRELLGGTEENSVSLMRGHCPPGKSIFFYKKEAEKNFELVARPGKKGLLPESIVEALLAPVVPFLNVLPLKTAVSHVLD